ncbi:MAG: asparagine synthase (glutamine-hydrolyzing) [Methanobacteriota archaeon]|nr:MAG: asparagine synthase (glutamine-hydrolyzing) [Euryarchaeota archaeon]
MCGICGIHDPKGNIDEGLIKKMSEAMVHRGPDDEGYYFSDKLGFGFKRLSIIDLETGNQPIPNEDETIWIVHNGEVYNFSILRKELEEKGHRFNTKSDTEVLVHGYEEWGEDIVHKLNGMYAFVIWDSRSEKLFMVRDRLGIKPLYYRLDGDRLVFASEIKALVVDSSYEKEVDLRALVDYLTFQNVFGTKTFFKGIRKLLPGHYAIMDSNGFRVKEYWDLEFDKAQQKEEDYYIEKYRGMLKESVAMELICDVPLGFQLSGGMDSSSVAVSAKGLVDKFVTFSGSFPIEGFDETPFAHQVAKSLNAEEHRISLQPEQVKGMLAKMVYHLDEPRVGPGSIPQYYVAKLASQHVKVVLTGHGGDELFAGYPAYLYAHLKETTRSKWGGSGREMLQVLKDLKSRTASEGWRRTIGLPLYTVFTPDLSRYAREAVFDSDEQKTLLSPNVRKDVKGYSTREILDSYREKKKDLTSLERLQYIDIKTYLPSLLDNEDRLCMAFSLESRVPILDHNIAEFSATIPSLLKVKGMTLKNIPRKAVKGLVPDEVIEHKKMGFPVPLAEWLRNGLGDYARDILLSPSAQKRGFFDIEYVKRLLDEHRGGSADHSEKIWCLLNFELWNTIFFDGDINAVHE